MLTARPVYTMTCTRKTYLSAVLIVALLSVDRAESCPKNCKSACNEPDGGCSTCKDGWFGRHCNHPLQCFKGKGKTYRGTLSVTENGITCQSWSKQQPNKHDWESLGDQRNYCRNPNTNTESKPWCYQTKGTRYGVCDVPKCQSQCPAPALSAFDEIINPPSSGFTVGYDLKIKTSRCRTGTYEEWTCKRDKKWFIFWFCYAIPGWCNKPVVTEPAYVLDNRSDFYYQNHTTVYCRAGYEIVGRDEITCQADKSWSHIPQCTPIPEWCSKPNVTEPAYIVNRTDNRNGFYYHTNLTILCRAGYVIAGDSQITCQANKSWSSIPRCIPVECSHPSLNHISYVFNNKTTYVYQDRITIECHDGYTRKGSLFLTCGADKLWNGTSTCDPVSCTEPILPENTEVTLTKESYVYKDTVNITCAVGFELKSKNTITCLANKTWSVIPRCTVVECRLPSLKKNVYVLNMKAKYIYLDDLKLGCHHGYTINGRSLFTCGADKAWDGHFPTCEPVSCSQPILPQHTKLVSTQESYLYKDTASLTCVKGFKLKDRNTITCQANKTWGTIPQCKPVKCSDKSLPSHLTILQGRNIDYEYLDTVIVGCRGNKEINGTNTTTCHHTGQWKQINAECIEKIYNDVEKVEAANAGSIVGSVTGAVIITGLIILVIYNRRRWNRYEFNIYCNGSDLRAHSRRGGKGNRHVSDDVEEGHLEGGYVSIMNIAELDNGDDNEKPNTNDFYNTSNDEKSTCIKIEHMANYVREKAMDLTFFENEFSKLKSGLQRSTYEACKPENKPKSKYRRIYPYDDNRVILVKNPSIPGSDFINASEIKGYGGRAKYIAAQGPQKTTVNDFWRMVWEQNCCGIVMLTNIFEDGKQKCEHYWPEEGAVTIGAITIELCTTDTYKDFTVRMLAISKFGLRRFIHHFHFSAWRDKSVPCYVYSLAQFRRKVFSIPGQTDGPLVVHCSAGIGRTGTFIAFDYLVDEARAEGSVDLFSCAKNLREQRVDMIQTKEQYVFLHEVLVDDIKYEVSTNEFYSRYKQLLMINPETGMTYLDERYQALNNSAPVLPLEECTSGRRLTVRDKNRYCNVLPVDRHRPFLIDSGGENEDYINAVYLPSHRDKNAFIATQMPLPNTVNDFWTLVYEEKVSAIVMLNETADKSCGAYWCENENTDKRFGPFKVSFASSQKEEGIIIRTLKVEKKPDQPRTVKQFMLTDWPDSAVVPSSPSSLLLLMDKVQTCQSEKQGAPVVVHCLTGTDKCGLFCTLMAIIDRLKMEHDVVIQQIITEMRGRRPQFIPNKDQYHFCHQCVHQYLKSCEVFEKCS